jgi:hypothetical protein
MFTCEIKNIYEERGKKEKVRKSRFVHHQLPLLLLCTYSNQSVFVDIEVQDFGKTCTDIKLFAFCTRDNVVLQLSDELYPKLKDSMREDGPQPVRFVRHPRSSGSERTQYTFQLPVAQLKERTFRGPVKLGFEGIYEDGAGGIFRGWAEALPLAAVYSNASFYYQDRAYAEGAFAFFCKDENVRDCKKPLPDQYRMRQLVLDWEDLLTTVDIFIKVTSECEEWIFSKSEENRFWLHQIVFQTQHLQYTTPTQEVKSCVPFPVVKNFFSGISSRDKSYCKLRHIARMGQKVCLTPTKMGFD